MANDTATVAGAMPKAGPLDVLQRFRYKRIKVIICEYLNTVCYLFAFKGEVYTQFFFMPDRHIIKMSGASMPQFREEAVKRLKSLATENIDYQRERKTLLGITKRSIRKVYGIIITYGKHITARGVARQQ